MSNPPSEVRTTVRLPHPVDVVWEALVSFPLEVVESDPRHRLVHRQEGVVAPTELIWELTPSGDGCHLAVTHSGHFGPGERPEDAREALETLVRRLSGLLALTARAEVQSGSKRWWHRLMATPRERRMRLLSVLVAMVLTVLAATAIANFGLARSHAPAALFPTSRGPTQFSQPAPSASAAPATSPALWPSASPSTANSVRTSPSAKGGYVGTITVQGGSSGLVSWTVLLELPEGVIVINAWDDVSFHQNDQRVTFRPAGGHRDLNPDGTFTFHFEVRGTGRPISCTVNGSPCAGLTT
jgi:hypothetical protein